jgi:manganese/zinc/iron transport system permease protein
MEPWWQDLVDTLLLRGYNTRLVTGTLAVLGMASGVAGAFLLLRGRALIADALSHACLPGIGLMFLIAVLAGGDGKALPLLLGGAAATGLLGVWLVSRIRDASPLKDDAAMGIVLGVFFGAGVVVLGLVQSMPGASAAGLEGFIYGKAASMTAADARWIAVAAIVTVVMSTMLFKEWRMLCFDQGYAAALGWPVRRLDLLLMGLLTMVTVIGLQAVGLILVVAFLILPAAAARFWTEQLTAMVWIAALIGALSGWLGAVVSAVLPDLPTGAVVILAGTLFFLISLLFGRARGVCGQLLQQRRLQRRMGRQHLLRAAYELLEGSHPGKQGQPANVVLDLAAMQRHRSWSPSEMRKLLRAAIAEDHVEFLDGKRFRLSESGFGEAVRTTRNHRLWERYLIDYADIAPSHVDRDADAVEHVLGAELVQRLEFKLGHADRPDIPPSPHPIGDARESRR